MKWVVAALLALNLGLFLWATGHRANVADPVGRPPINPATMQLLSEQDARTRSTSGDATAARCFRVGPFYDANTLALAGQKLGLLRVPYQQRTVKEREIRAHRVYLGPFRTQSAVEAQRNLLRTAGISEHYVKREPGDVSVISLGLFSQADSAQSLIRDLKEKNVSAKAREESRILGPTYWLELKDPPANARAGAGLNGARWGDPRAELRPFPCV